MAATADYLNNLIVQRNALADNLAAKGVNATHDELFDTLVPKVLDINSQGGGDTFVVLGNRIDYRRIDSDWKILVNGSSLSDKSADIIGYEVTPGSVIYVKANDNYNECKFIWQKDTFNVTSLVPNPYLIAEPVTDIFDGLILVPENADWICFSRQKTDTETGIYTIKKMIFPK